MNDLFRKFSVKISNALGTPWAFIFAVTIVTIWAVTGPMFDFSTTWQLFINTFTTITTFVMVFVIQNTQNRDARATHIKLDELIRGIKGARDTIMNVEELPDNELEEYHLQFQILHEKAQKELEKRKTKKIPLPSRS